MVPLPLLNDADHIFVESDDDTPDNTHTQRVLAEYYMSTQGSLPAWLPSPPIRSKSAGTSSSSHQPTPAAASSGPGGSMYRSGSKPNFLQDIYASTSPANQTSYAQHSNGRTQDLSPDYARRGDQFRDKLRGQASSSSSRSGKGRDPEVSDSFHSGRRGYPGRSPRGGTSSREAHNPPSQTSDFRSLRGYGEEGTLSDRSRDYYSRQ